MRFCKDHGEYYDNGNGCPGCRQESEDWARHREVVSESLTEQNEIARESLEIESEWLDIERERNELLREEAAAMTACKFCGQRYARTTKVKPPIGRKWVGKLGKFATTGVCPRCYHQRSDMGEEGVWVHAEWLDWLAIIDSWDWKQLAAIRPDADALAEFTDIRDRYNDIMSKKRCQHEKEMREKLVSQLRADLDAAKNSSQVQRVIKQIPPEETTLLTAARVKHADLLNAEEAQKDAERAIAQAASDENVRLKSLVNRWVMMSWLSLILGCGCFAIGPIYISMTAQYNLRRVHLDKVEFDIRRARFYCFLGYGVLGFYLLLQILGMMHIL